MREKRTSAMDRRNFLRAVGGASTAAVAAVAVSDRRDRGAGLRSGRGRDARSRYQADSPDVKAFYRTNGYETLKK